MLAPMYLQIYLTPFTCAVQNACTELLNYTTVIIFDLDITVDPHCSLDPFNPNPCKSKWPLL